MGLDHYSYSSLTLFNTCPYAFYLEKIEGVDVVDNAFAQHGSLCHELIEEWANGQLKVDELPNEFKERYPITVTASFPPYLAGGNYKQQVYDKGLGYFNAFDQFEGYHVIAAEKYFETNIDDHKFTGVIDLILQSDNGDSIICDHKSKSLSSFKKNKQSMYRQQYLYSKPYYEMYGEFPKYLMFNLFNENVQVMQPFKQEEYEEALEWARSTIGKIESCGILDFLETKKEDMFCREICSVRNSCGK